jgi:hypothetical protein
LQPFDVPKVCREVGKISVAFLTNISRSTSFYFADSKLFTKTWNHSVSFITNNEKPHILFWDCEHFKHISK